MTPPEDLFGALEHVLHKDHRTDAPVTQYTKSEGLNLAYQVFGQGPTVVLIPPLISNVKLGWDQERYRRALEHIGR